MNDVPQPAPAHTDLAAEQHSLQVSHTVGALPLFLVFHVSAAVSVVNLTHETPLASFTMLWMIPVILVGLCFLAVFLMWRRPGQQVHGARYVHALEALALALGLVWAVPPALMAQIGQSSVTFPLAGMTLAIVGIGALSLNRIPIGATVFVALVVASLARGLYQALDGSQAMAAVICAIYGLVLVGITLNNHWDFLQRTEAEREVKRQGEVIGFLLNDFERGSRDWLFETDAKGHLTYFSPRMAEVLGVEPASLRMRLLRHVLAEHKAAAEWRKVELAMIARDELNGLQIDLVLNGKPVCWQITAQPRTDDSGEYLGYRGVFRDVTQARDSQFRLEEAMAASESANAAKSQFLSVMSHELRTPINAMVGFSELLVGSLDGSISEKNRREYARDVHESALQLQSLITDLLDTTRIERGSMVLNEQRHDAADLTEAAIRSCRRLAENAGINIVGRLTDGITVEGDSARLQQIIGNLLKNAIKFSQAGGIVNIDMERGSQGQFVLSVRDGGIGIAAQDIERVFDAFVQADSGLGRRYGGAGLGLSIARRLARLHEGDVTLESAPSRGTTAKFVLPAHRIGWAKPKARPEMAERKTAKLPSTDNRQLPPVSQDT